MNTPRSARFMTFRELLDGKHEASSGTCRFCKAWNVPGRYYGPRHFVCSACCEKRADEKLPSVDKSERHARAYARRLGDPMPPKFLAHLAGVTVEYAEWALSEAAAERAAKPAPDIAL